MLRVKDRTEGGGDDRLALGAEAGHVVEIMRIHAESGKEAGNPAILFWRADTDSTVALAACFVELFI